MGFLDDIGSTISNTGRDVASYSNKRTQMSSFQMELQQLERRRNEVLCAIGRQYAERHAGEDYADTEFPAELEELTIITREIEQTEKYLRTLSGVIKCGSCGAEIRIDSTFCPVCGSRRDPDSEDRQTDQKICPKCGRFMPKDAAFCTGCGNRL